MQRLLLHGTWRLSSSRLATDRPSAWSHDDQHKASERTRSSRESLAQSLLQVAFTSLLSINKLSPRRGSPWTTLVPNSTKGHVLSEGTGVSAGDEGRLSGWSRTIHAQYNIQSGTLCSVCGIAAPIGLSSRQSRQYPFDYRTQYGVQKHKFGSILASIACT